MSEQNERGSRTGRSAGPHKASHRHGKNLHLRQWSCNEERVQYLIKLIRELKYVCPSQANNDTKVSLSEKIRGDIAHKFKMTISKVTIDHILKEEIKKYEIRKRDQNDQVIGDFERDLEQILEQMKINERRKDESIKKKREKDRRRQYTSEVRKTSMESMPETHKKLKRSDARELPTLCPSRAALLFIRNSFGLNESLTQVSKWRDGSPNLLILIARAPDEARALGNQEAVTAALASLAARRGLQFFLFQGHNTTMAHTIRTFNAARLVVGVHGAGLANTVFCSPYAAILELGLPEPEFIEYRHLAQQLHLHYAVSQLPPASFESRLWPRPNVIAQAAEALLDAAIPLPLSSSSSSSS